MVTGQDRQSGRVYMRTVQMLKPILLLVQGAPSALSLLSCMTLAARVHGPKTCFSDGSNSPLALSAPLHSVPTICHSSHLGMSWTSTEMPQLAPRECSTSLQLQPLQAAFITYVTAQASALASAEQPCPGPCCGPPHHACMSAMHTCRVYPRC